MLAQALLSLGGANNGKECEKRAISPEAGGQLAGPGSGSK
jgi:hypothetical protein